MVNVLVVDDSPIDRRLVGRLVGKSTGLVAAYANDGEEAIAAIEASPPDIVVTDLLMPRLDGLQLVGHIRRHHPMIPVVLMTAHGSEEAAAAALAAGAASYVPKRNLASHLADTLENVLAVTRAVRDEQLVYSLLVGGELSFVADADEAAIGPLVRHLESYPSRLGICDEGARIQVGIALREALVNAIEHGCLGLDSVLKEEQGELHYRALADERRQEAPYRDRRVRVRTVLTPDSVTYVFADDGEGFDPAGLPDATDPENLDRIHGRGLLLIQTFMDEVRHNELGNEIIMIKRRPAGPSPDD